MIKQNGLLLVTVLNNNGCTINVFGGNQLRPNLHILDYCDAVKTLILASSEKVNNQIFNVGYQNMSIREIAKVVQKVVQDEFPEFGKIQIITTKSDDNRSYHINSDKIKKILNFQPTRGVEDAVKELCNCFKKKLFKNTFEDDFYFNLKRLKRLNVS